MHEVSLRWLEDGGAPSLRRDLLRESACSVTDLHRGELAGRRNAGGLGFLYRWIVVGQSRLEAANTLAEAFSKFSDLTGAEDQQSYAEDYCKFRESEFSDHKSIL